MHEGLDLFGQVVVTWPEVRRWLVDVAKIEPEGPRAEAYIRAWNVPQKIAQAKLAEVKNPRGITSSGATLDNCGL